MNKNIIFTHTKRKQLYLMKVGEEVNVISVEETGLFL